MQIESIEISGRLYYLMQDFLSLTETIDDCVLIRFLTCHTEFLKLKELHGQAVPFVFRYKCDTVKKATGWIHLIDDEIISSDNIEFSCVFTPDRP